MVKTASFKLTCTPDRRHRSSINQPNGMSSAARDYGVEAREPLELPAFSCRDRWRTRGHVCSQGNV